MEKFERKFKDVNAQIDKAEKKVVRKLSNRRNRILKEDEKNELLKDIFENYKVPESINKKVKTKAPKGNSYTNFTIPGMDYTVKYMNGIGFKICKCCQLEKTIDNFHKDNKNKDGFRISCKTCRKGREDYLKRKNEQ